MGVETGLAFRPFDELSNVAMLRSNGPAILFCLFQSEEEMRDHATESEAQARKIQAPSKLRKVYKALKKWSPLDAAIGESLGLHWATLGSGYRGQDQVAWPSAQDGPAAPVTGASLAVLLEGASLVSDPDGEPLLVDGEKMPFGGQRLYGTKVEDGTEVVYSVRTSRNNLLVVALGPWSASQIPAADSKELGPWPYYVHLSYELSASNIAACIAKCLGKLLGLAEESIDPTSISAPDFYGRVLPNLWVSSDLDSELCPWAQLMNADDTKSIREQNEAVSTEGGFGLSHGPGVGLGLESGYLSVRRPGGTNTGCLMQHSLTELAQGVRRRERQFCPVCSAHLNRVLRSKYQASSLTTGTTYQSSSHSLGGAAILPWEGGAEYAPWSQATVTHGGGGTLTSSTTPAEQDARAQIQAKWSDTGWTADVTTEAVVESFLSALGRTVLVRIGVTGPTAGESVVTWKFTDALWSSDVAGTQVSNCAGLSASMLEAKRALFRRRYQQELNFEDRLNLVFRDSDGWRGTAEQDDVFATAYAAAASSSGRGVFHGSSGVAILRDGVDLGEAWPTELWGPMARAVLSVLDLSTLGSTNWHGADDMIDQEASLLLAYAFCQGVAVSQAWPAPAVANGVTFEIVGDTLKATIPDGVSSGGCTLVWSYPGTHIVLNRLGALVSGAVLDGSVNSIPAGILPNDPNKPE